MQRAGSGAVYSAQALPGPPASVLGPAERTELLEPLEGLLADDDPLAVVLWQAQGPQLAAALGPLAGLFAKQLAGYELQGALETLRAVRGTP